MYFLYARLERDASTIIIKNSGWDKSRGNFGQLRGQTLFFMGTVPDDFCNGKAKTGTDAMREYRSRLGGQTPQTETAFPERVCRFTNGLALGSEMYVDAMKIRAGLVHESPDFVPLSSGKDRVDALRSLKSYPHFRERALFTVIKVLVPPQDNIFMAHIPIFHMPVIKNNGLNTKATPRQHSRDCP